MTKTSNQAFHLKNLNELRSEIKRMKQGIQVSDDVSVLGTSLKAGGKVVPNRFCVLPMEGGDALPDGSPGELTVRRYTRFAAGGWGMIWVEATAFLADARSNPSQLCLLPGNVGAFERLVKSIRNSARGRNVVIILQLTHPGRYCRPDGTAKPYITHHNPALDRMHGIAKDYPVVTDEYLDRLQDAFVGAARLAAQAGFDGVDVKCCHKNLLAELLASRTRNGKYGGSFGNRTRFLREVVARTRKEVPGLLLASRMSAYDAVAYPYGFGVKKGSQRMPDLSEPIELAKMLKRAGVSILNISMDNPAAPSGQPFDVMADSMSVAGEDPLAGLGRIHGITARISKAVPGLPVVGRGFTWFRQFMPNVAAGAIKSGAVSIAGAARGALAYPDMPADIMAGGIEPVKCCIACSACMQTFRDGGRAGCVIRDSAIYGPEYRQRRMFDAANLRQEAQRCHYCESATCTAGCPAHIDVPGFIRAYAEGDVDEAFRIIRRSNVLAEMCSNLCPTWLMCEGACIESALSMNPIRIKDLQYAVCWTARSRGLTGAKIPARSSGRKVAIVGAGPAGASCAAKLLECGHEVVIFERADQAGGTPQAVIRSGRISGVKEEVDAVLRPGILAGRLVIKYGRELGKNITLKDLREEHDAVLLAAGLWKELSLGRVGGVMDALTFLGRVKRGELKSVPRRVAILSGGDSAMDASVLAKELGAADLYLVYPGSLSEMHWHMDDAWFRTSGANLLSLAKPLGYETDRNGRLTGIRICRMEYGPADSAGRRKPRMVPGSESVLKVDMVIEAMGLGVADDLKKAAKGVKFNKLGLVKTAGNSCATGLRGVFAAGGLVNGGASVVHCIAGGMAAAEEIDRFVRRGAGRRSK